MKKKNLTILLLLFAIICIDGKKISKSRSSGSGRGSSRKTNSNPSPTSLSYPQSQAQPAPKPSLFGWQEKPAQRTQTSNKQTHSYPSSQTGLSGNSPPKQQATHQEGIQKSNIPQNSAGQQLPSHTGVQTQTNNQQSHSYPGSSGLSGNPGSGAGYPQQQGGGLSGSGAAAPPAYSAGNYPNNNFGNNYHQQQGPPPPYSNSGSSGGIGYPKQQGYGQSGPGAAAPPPYSGGHYPTNNFGNNYHHPQGAPPPYSNNYGGYGGYHSPQAPGYFGNYGNQRFGGVGRTGSALTGVGIAGAGIGTVLTGLALWNLARSTGNHRHTVIYDNRGQPVAVAPNNSTEPVVDPILGDLVNCTLTISNDNATEVLAIPCSIATSFTPDADVKDSGSNTNANDNTKCTVTVVTKAGKEFMTTIPCSILLNTAAENNVTEPPLLSTGSEHVNGTIMASDDSISSSPPSALRLSGEADLHHANPNCTVEPGNVRDPINPCFSVTHNLTVIPLSTDRDSQDLLATPSSA